MIDLGASEVDERVVVVGTDGYVEVWPARPETHETTLYAIGRGFWGGTVLFDAAGRAWRPGVDIPPGVGRTRRFLARSIGNERLVVTITYPEPRTYDLAELKRSLTDALALDDDVLTQFHDAEDITAWIDAASSFAEVVAALERAAEPERSGRTSRAIAEPPASVECRAVLAGAERRPRVCVVRGRLRGGGGGGRRRPAARNRARAA
jgi:hypothetical protein